MMTLCILHFCYPYAGLAIMVGHRTFSNQFRHFPTKISVRPKLGHVANSTIDGGSDFQHEDRTVSKMELVIFPPCKEFSVSYALKEIATCVGGE